MPAFNIRNSAYQFLRLLIKGKSAETNGNTKPLQISCDYSWVQGNPGPNPVLAAKSSLVTTANSGFNAIVVAALLAALNARWVSIGVYARWLDVLEDPFTATGAMLFTTAGAIGTAPSALPLDNCVTIRKNTGIRGRNFRGSWHIPCIDKTHSTDDELNSTGQPFFRALANALNTNIGDGTYTMVPTLISGGGSQMERQPVRIAGAQFAGSSAGWNGTTVPAPSILLPVNITLGTAKKRKERPSLTI